MSQRLREHFAEYTPATLYRHLLLPFPAALFSLTCRTASPRAEVGRLAWPCGCWLLRGVASSPARGRLRKIGAASGMCVQMRFRLLWCMALGLALWLLTAAGSGIVPSALAPEGTAGGTGNASPTSRHLPAPGACSSPCP